MGKQALVRFELNGIRMGALYCKDVDLTKPVNQLWGDQANRRLIYSCIYSALPLQHGHIYLITSEKQRLLSTVSWQKLRFAHIKLLCWRYYYIKPSIPHVRYPASSGGKVTHPYDNAIWWRNHHVKGRLILSHHTTNSASNQIPKKKTIDVIVYIS